MTDLRRFSLAAVVLLVVLRIGIGWQLLYEGLWKIQTLHSSKPWTSAGYLKNSVGPMRNVFRNMAGDPDETGWLDYNTVAARWQDWAKRFKKHYRLSGNQSGSLDRLMYGAVTKVGDLETFAVPLDKLPSGVDKLNVSEKIVWFDGKEKRLYVNGSRLLKPDEKRKLETLVKDREDAESVAFLKAVNAVYDRQKKGMGYLRKLAGALKGDPALQSDEKWQKLGKKDQYLQQLEAYERDYAKASTDFDWDHLKHRWGKIQAMRAELTGPIKAMETELVSKAEGMLTIEQQGRGAASKPWTMLRFTDTMTILGLTILGGLLIVGLFTRFAAFAAAFMLFNFYLAMPPFPGVPELPGPEHSFIINKNLIEVFALLALAVIPTGIWFGLDGTMGAFLKNWKADSKVSKSLKSSIATGDEPKDVPEVATAT